MVEDVQSKAGVGSRRRFVAVGVSSAVVLCSKPSASAWAQAASQPQLQSLPKVALVFGNAAYKQSPLRNPTNDAKGMAEVLNSLGFEVTIRLDAGRASMLDAMASFTATLARRKCIGLFYFAGHGVQINWKNYLLPVDALVGSNEDVENRAVPVNGLIDGLGRAGNALNLVILDACRDAPFGEAKKVDQKGLSQMDAPASTLLPYATSPGNVASDVRDGNGLYTEQLLREIRAPEAKVEDVFKRVRRAVRRESRGRQIPWESTSLEDDFYFVPPTRLSQPSDKERQTRFARELTLWESVEDATAPEPFESYLRQYPSGNFAELAQFRLEMGMRKRGDALVKMQHSKDNPYVTPSSESNTAYRIGDSYRFRLVGKYNGKALSTIFTHTVSRITETEVHFNDGKITTDLLGNTNLNGEGNRDAGSQVYPTEYFRGKKWNTHFTTTLADRRGLQTEYEFRVLGLESLSVPAGSFNCFFVEGKGRASGASRGGDGRLTTSLTYRYWISPDLSRRPVKWHYVREVAGPIGRQPDREHDFVVEMVSFRQS